MKRVVITGMSGVIGSILGKTIHKKAGVVNLSHKKYKPEDGEEVIYFDLLDKAAIPKKLDKAKADIIVHLAAITHIDICENDKPQGKKGIVWKTNVEGTSEIANYCAKNKIPLIFLSTECVFDGKAETFSENAIKNPINWYGFTKSAAEDTIFSSGANAAIIRSVVAYHKNLNSKTIYGTIVSALKSGKKISAVSDQLFTPTYTYDIAKAIWKVIQNNMFGIYHVSSSKSITPHDFVQLVAQKNGFSDKNITKTTLNEYYGHKRAMLRLKHACLSGEKSNTALGFTPMNVEDVL